MANLSILLRRIFKILFIVMITGLMLAWLFLYQQNKLHGKKFNPIPVTVNPL
ncbi:hypothetical protein SAMN02745664_10760 [Moraxella cuniculi DSM 21768]|uniref:Uncharacterized protein n=1 Tax=Moraxella cuniculi DSM 21768 TaxID=1122245 RepID=A0A1N7ETG5_9GAMM|nr:hypothetical protein SAMN02745664_10760 [Moraxella cuniculi DSM 21768]